MPAAFARGDTAFQRGEYAHAVEAYRAFLQQPSDDVYVPRAWYRIALSQYRLQDYRAALATLDELRTRFPTATWPQAQALRGDAHLALDNKVSALEAWAEAWRVADAGDRPALQTRFDRTVEGLNQTERLRAKEVIAEPTIRTWLDRPPASAAPPAANETGRTVAAAPTPRTGPAPAGARIGCLLPLSGEYRAFGERSLQGIRLALDADSSRLVVKDIGGGVEAARRAFAELVAEADVVAVIGPLHSEAAADIAPRAEAAQLPVLLLAPREGLTGRYVLQTAMTRADQADQVARHALERRWRHFGVLAPSDSYGRTFAEKFSAAIQHHGGRVTWTDFYDPQQHDATTQIAHARERHAQGLLDAIFLPDRAAAAVAVGTALRAAMPDIGLLGPQEWNEPATLSSAGAALDGALFVTGFFADSARPATRAFVEAFRSAHGVAPDVFAAQAYDAGVLLHAALQRGAGTRAAVLDALRQLERVPGATGDMRMTAAGLARPLFVLRVAGGRLEEVDASSPRS